MDTTFAELGLNERILTGVTTLGFNTPTPIQAAAIPAVLAGKDVVASAQTGTGKTAAFVLPALQVIDTDTEDEKTDRPEVQCQPQDEQQQSSQQKSQRRRQRQHGSGRRRNRTRDPQALIVPRKLNALPPQYAKAPVNVRLLLPAAQSLNDRFPL